VSSESETLIAELEVERDEAILRRSETVGWVEELTKENKKLKEVLDKCRRTMGSMNELDAWIGTQCGYEEAAVACSILDDPEEESHTYPDGSKITIKAKPAK